MKNSARGKKPVPSETIHHEYNKPILPPDAGRIDGPRIAPSMIRVVLASRPVIDDRAAG